MFKFILGLVIGTIVGFFYAGLCRVNKETEEFERKLFEREFGDSEDEN